jgi:SAM-dependent methyltransferase
MSSTLTSTDVMATSPVPCRACGERDGEPWVLSDFYTCRACGLLYYGAHVSPEELTRFYQEDYYHGKAYVDYLGDRAAMEKTFGLKVKRLAPVLAQAKRVYEVGCAYGFFLNLVAPGREVAGIDLNPAGVAFAREQLKLDVRCGDFLDADVRANHYDMFCMWDTIEHLSDPGRYIERISRLAKPGSYLSFTTGDVGSFIARTRGPRWRLIAPPAHLSYFSRETATRLLERHGWKVENIDSIGVHRSLRQVVIGVLKLKPGPGSLHEKVSGSNLLAASFYLDLGDIMMVTARKN